MLELRRKRNMYMYPDAPYYEIEYPGNVWNGNQKPSKEWLLANDPEGSIGYDYPEYDDVGFTTQRNPDPRLNRRKITWKHKKHNMNQYMPYSYSAYQYTKPGKAIYRLISEPGK